jgi:HEAT repeat protein
MQPVEIARLLALRGLLSAGWSRAARKLLEGLRSEDETTRSLAATLLARSGPQALDALREAVQEEESLPFVLTMLGDLGDKQDEETLAKFATHHDAQVQTAAKYALEVLHARLNAAGGAGAESFSA